jgi:TolA-binding protein
MRRMFSGCLWTALLLSAAAFGQSGQSLGDVARANREKQAAQGATGTRPKVITNQDLPTEPGEISESDASSPMTMVSGVNRPFDERSSDERFTQQGLADQRVGAEWRERIQTQESRIAQLQGRIDQMNAAIHGSSGGVQYERYTRYQARQMQRVAQMQDTLDQQKQKLVRMQEAARHAGMHTTVYDP